MQLSSVEYTHFTTPHIEKLKWNRQQTRPVMRLKDGSKYEITLPGKNVEELKNLTLSDWKNIAEQIDRILTQKGILNEREEAPVNARALDQLLINKKGVVFSGTLYKHGEGEDTKNHYKQLKSYAKGHVSHPPQAERAERADLPAQVPSQPMTVIAAKRALEAVPGCGSRLLQAAEQDIDSLINDNWQGSAFAIADHRRVDSLLQAQRIPENREAEIAPKVEALYNAQAVELIANSIFTEVEQMLRERGDLNRGERESLIEGVVQDMLEVYSLHISGGHEQLNSKVRRQLCTLITEDRIREATTSCLERLLREYPAPKSLLKQTVNATKSVGRAVRGIYHFFQED